jgi:hypothetical protein
MERVELLRVLALPGTSAQGDAGGATVELALADRVVEGRAAHEVPGGRRRRYPARRARNEKTSAAPFDPVRRTIRRSRDARRLRYGEQTIWKTRLASSAAPSETSLTYAL